MSKEVSDALNKVLFLNHFFMCFNMYNCMDKCSLDYIVDIVWGVVTIGISVRETKILVLTKKSSLLEALIAQN